MENVDIEPQLVEMVETMELIHLKNMQWFSREHMDVYKLLAKEAKKITKNKDKEKFTVELRQDGALDIHNKKKDTFVYNIDPFTYGDEKAKAVKAKKVKKIIFDGTVLGTHITSVIKEHKPKKVLVAEKNIQIFRCSSYVIDYEELNKISIFEFCLDKSKYEIGKKDLVISIDDL